MSGKRKSIAKKRTGKIKITDVPSVEDVIRARRIVSHILERLENGMSNTELVTSKEDKFLWGEKDNVISILGKLTQMMLKLIPAEQQIIDDYADEQVDQKEISSEDMDILQRFISRYINENKIR